MQQFDSSDILGLVLKMSRIFCYNSHRSRLCFLGRWKDGNIIPDIINNYHLTRLTNDTNDIITGTELPAVEYQRPINTLQTLSPAAPVHEVICSSLSTRMSQIRIGRHPSTMAQPSFSHQQFDNDFITVTQLPDSFSVIVNLNPQLTDFLTTDYLVIGCQSADKSALLCQSPGVGSLVVVMEYPY